MATNNALIPGPPLPRSRLFLAISVALFATWVGWLGYLAFTTTRPIVLSRPQFLTADLDIIGEVEAKDGRPDAQVKVKQVLWARNAEVRPAENGSISVVNLPAVTPKDGWAGPAAYILPLVKQDSSYALAPIGASPGFSSVQAGPRIYRVTRDGLAQHQQIRPQR